MPAADSKFPSQALLSLERYRNNELFRRLVESVTDYAIFMLDPNGIVVTWNAGAERLKGYRAEDILGRHVSLFYPPEAAHGVSASVALDTARREGHFEEEGWRVRKDGSRFYAHVTISAIPDGRGGVGGFAKVTRDLTERRRADTTSRERSRLTSILDCLSDAVIVCDRDGKFIHMNRAALSLIGPAHREGDGLAGAAARYGAFRSDGATPFPASESAMARALAGESVDEVEMMLRNPGNPDGVWISACARPLLDETGAAVGAVLVAHDISNRRRASEELARQKVLLQSVLDCAAEMIAVFDNTGALVLSNPAFERATGHLTGSGAPAAGGARGYELFSHDGKQRLAAEESPSMRAIRGESVHDTEIVIRTATPDRERVVSVNAVQLRDPAGAVLGAVLTGRDVTARASAERRLLEQSSLLISILDCLGEGVVVYDSAGRIILTNPAAERALHPGLSSSGTLEERLRGYTVLSLDGTRELPVEETAAGQALRGASCDDLEILVRSAAEPEGRAFSTNGRALRRADGSSLGAVVTSRDISARKRVEREKESLLSELTRSNVELAQFAHVVSHDLRAPLRAIDTLAQWLAEDLRPHLTPDTALQMSLLQSRVKRMEALVADLLSFARLGRIEGETVRVNLDELIAEVVELAGPPPGFRVVRQIAVPTIDTVVLPLKRALLNLVGNAFKHHDRSPGELRVATLDRGPVVEFEISDDGPGIPAAFHRRIFEPFQTLKPRDVVEGSGMGLAFVKKIAEHARGAVTVESVGRGSTFRLDWPKVWQP